MTKKDKRQKLVEEIAKAVYESIWGGNYQLDASDTELERSVVRAKAAIAAYEKHLPSEAEIAYTIYNMQEQVCTNEEIACKIRNLLTGKEG